MIKTAHTVENLLETTKLSLYSLFTVDEPYSSLSCLDAQNLLNEATDAAVALVSRPVVIDQIRSRI